MARYRHDPANGWNRRYSAVDAPFRRRTGVASIAPVANGGSTIDTRPSLSTPLGFRRLRVGAGRVRRQLPLFGHWPGQPIGSGGRNTPFRPERWNGRRPIKHRGYRGRLPRDPHDRSAQGLATGTGLHAPKKPCGRDRETAPVGWRAAAPGPYPR